MCAVWGGEAESSQSIGHELSSRTVRWAYYEVVAVVVVYAAALLFDFVR
jgi:hypothetical protein